MIYIPKGIHLNNFAHGKPNMYCKGPYGDPIATLSSVCCCLKTTLSMIWKITHMWKRWSTTQNTIEKMKNLARDIIILQMCTKNHNHMYSSWDRVRLQRLK